MNSSYNNTRNQGRASNYQGRNNNRPPTRSNAPTRFTGKRKRQPPKLIHPDWETRAVKRDHRSQRIEYHVINLLRERMAPEQFDKMMNIAKRLADKEIKRIEQEKAKRRAEREAAKAAKKTSA